MLNTNFIRHSYLDMYVFFKLEQVVRNIHAYFTSSHYDLSVWNVQGLPAWLKWFVFKNHLKIVAHQWDATKRK